MASPDKPRATATDPAHDLDVDRIKRAWMALMAYRGLSLQVFDSQAVSFAHLPHILQSLVPAIPIRLSHAADAVEHNADLLERIATLTGVSTPFLPEHIPPNDLDQTVADFPDVVDTLLAVVRDWSAHGHKDRIHMYDPVIAAVRDAANDHHAHLEQLSHSPSADPQQPDSEQPSEQDPFRVLVIGASLGRLSWELARLGLSVQGVETSYLQLFASNFILNGAATPQRPLTLHPFVHHTGMVAAQCDQLASVSFPDVDPRFVASADFSMVAGEFLDLYQQPSSWHCVVTCFALENSHSVLSYVRRIASILKPAGVWVNHGTLDFRYDDAPDEPSVEITLDELQFAVARSGLRVLRRESFNCRPPYVVNGMVSEQYATSFFVAVKV